MQRSGGISCKKYPHSVFSREINFPRTLTTFAENY